MNFDVSLSPRNKIYVLKVKYKDNAADVDFDGVDTGYIYDIGNLKALQRKVYSGSCLDQIYVLILPFMLQYQSRKFHSCRKDVLVNFC